MLEYRFTSEELSAAVDELWDKVMDAQLDAMHHDMGALDPEQEWSRIEQLDNLMQMAAHVLSQRCTVDEYDALFG